MKKVMSLIMAITMVFALCSCALMGGYSDDNAGENSQNNENNASKEDVRVAVLSGPTGMGIVKLIADNKDGKTQNNYKIDIYASPEEIIAKIKLGEYDLAALPTNVAAKLYNMNDVNVQMAAINTLGVLYMLEANTQTVNSVADLKGKTIYTTGEGANPQYVLEYILEKNGLEVGKDVNVVYEADADKALAAITNGTTDVVMLPEPKVTATLKSMKNVRIALDMTNEWDKVADYTLTQGCVVSVGSFSTDKKAALDIFLEEYAASIKYVNENTEKAAELVVAAGIIAKAPIAKDAIKGCKLVCMTDDEMKNAIKPFYELLFAENPKSIGGKVPNDDFYYVAK